MTPPDLSIDTARAQETLHEETQETEIDRVSPLSAELRSIVGDSTPVSRDGPSMEEADEIPLHAMIETPAIPERRATIKTGGKLKARPSGTPADFEALVAAQAAAGAD